MDVGIVGGVVSRSRSRLVLAILATGATATVSWGCAGESAVRSEPAAMRAADTTAVATTPETPRPYVPSAHHRHRPPHAIYDDEIGENVVGTSYRRIRALFGAPLEVRATRTGPCVYYRIVHQPDRGWEFCFVHARMTSAEAIPHRDFRSAAP